MVELLRYPGKQGHSGAFEARDDGGGRKKQSATNPKQIEATQQGAQADTVPTERQGRRRDVRIARSAANETLTKGTGEVGKIIRKNIDKRA